MASYSYVQSLVSLLEKENKLKNAELWLAHEVLYLLNKYPELQDYIDKNLSNLSLSEILVAFFKMLRQKKKYKRPNYRALPPKKLKKLRLSHYLLAGFMISSAFRYCYNHRYNVNQHIEWEIDFTDAEKEVLRNLNSQQFIKQVTTGAIDKSKTTNKNKLKP